MDAEKDSSVVAKFILTGAEQDSRSEKEAAEFGDVLFTDDQLYGYRSIVHKTYFVLTHVVRVCPDVFRVLGSEELNCRTARQLLLIHILMCVPYALLA